MSRFGRASRAAAPKEPIQEADADLVTGTGMPYGLVDMEKEAKSAPTCHIEVAVHSVKNWGGRHENEDRHMAHQDTFGSVNFHTIGVLDGHDTDSASDLVARTLPGVLSKQLKEGKTIEQGYVAAMAELEDALKKIHASAGTCVCSCTVAGRYVWCANLGDCRAVLLPLQVPETAAAAKATKVQNLVWMSRDHKANLPEEKRRIAAAGGHVVDGRVEGLEPSRTLGDFDVKMQVKKGVISIVPDVRRYELGDGQPGISQALLVCCTDGVWDVMSGQDVVDLIHARKELAALQASICAGEKANCQPLRDFAGDLVDFSIARGSRDDCTAVCALISVLPPARGGR
mmetsp:Transcript_4209/g.10845  ORF Transcript_4209/g.10845 Transcript_4209/m.10845 type:complete len:343 (-) Transcript_4209:70-1098(-)|eukprot:CAMPEP_0195113966 /NCGR_PEP_ID=MMETSP0448-20130528/104501_1 /TAXON_ID=66468 /ORGANISM="Heterocapsa triquestra, Strain CCMP 448" /LENGTH=342 /DNA_ID=CAMNT_0040150965 /DNA_START=98 /DNA_END=1126 /DNA_ORIENTATION=+